MGRLRSTRLFTRPGAGDGWWLSYLLPFGTALTFVKVPNEDNALSFVVSIIFILTSTIYICDCHFKKSLALYVSASMISSVLAFSSGKGFILGFVYGLLASCGFHFGLESLLAAAPRSFSLGEGSVLIQTLILFVISSGESLKKYWYFVPTTCKEISTVVLQVGLLGLLIISAILYCIPQMRKLVGFLTVVGLVVLGGILPFLYVILQRDPIFWIISLLLKDFYTVLLVMFWLLCVTVSVACVTFQIDTNQKASTALRKTFHILAVIVYLPGLIYSCCLLYTASGVVLALFIFLEIMRVLNIPVVGDVLNQGFAVYSDEKDVGGLSLTPIYLLAGVSFPIWIHSTSCTATDSAGVHLLPLMSGILSIGVGDTAASIAGSLWGQHKWPNSEKSFEGTAACVISQVFLLLFLSYLGFLQFSIFSFLRTLVAIIITSLLEAWTDQIDNLVLPIAMYIMLV